MWIFCDSGFFSVVRKDPSDEMLTVRARVRVYHRVWAETLQLEFSDQDER